MKKHAKKLFIPHEDNDYRPHLLREAGVIVLALIAILSFGFSVFHASILVKNSDLIAAIFPAVLVDLTNESRVEDSLGNLSPNSTLQEAAQQKANHMAENGYFAHTSPGGLTPWHWFVEAGYQFTHAGENLAVNFVDSGDVVQAWLDSPGHRANILNNDFTEIGIATAEGTYQGQTTVFVVQLFGRPLPVALAPEPTVASEDITVEDVEENLEVLEESDLFVAVQNTEALEETPDDTEAVVQAPADPLVDTPAVEAEEAVGLQTNQATLVERLASQPRTVLNWIYMVLAAVIVLGLTFYTLIEIEKHHPKHVAYGVLLLILLVVLVYANKNYIIPDLEVPTCPEGQCFSTAVQALGEK